MKNIYNFNKSFNYVMCMEREQRIICFGDSIRYYATDTGDEIIDTDFYDFTKRDRRWGDTIQRFMSFYGGILKILAHTDYKYSTKDVFSSAVSAKVYRFFTDDIQLIRVNIITDKKEEVNYNFAIPLNELYDPEKNILNITDCTIKIYYRLDGSDKLLLFASLPGVITDERYNYDVQDGNIHFIDDGEDIILSNFDYLLVFYSQIFKIIVPKEYVGLTQLTLIYIIDGNAEGEDNWYLPEIDVRIKIGENFLEKNPLEYKFYRVEFLPISEDIIKEYEIKLFYREDDNHIAFLKRIPLIYKVKVFRRDNDEHYDDFMH